ncbi:MAG: class I tRNA ligase family protein [Patescibacteria group bacterium]|jgi:leucyl-tRNA synthetase
MFIMSYPFSEIEPKWQAWWEKQGVYHAKDPSETGQEKFYGLVEFPYPSGEGLHVGHPRPYTAIDILTRKRRMEGKNVLYPMGWDAFGLPTENYAIKTKQPPAKVTAKNITNFKRQIQMLGLGFDWSREINTTDPEYYKWTQWMFIKFFDAWFDEKMQKARPIAELVVPKEIEDSGSGAVQEYRDAKRLAFKQKTEINWCPKDKIGLANEEAVGGICDRCGGPVEKREKEQWMLRITSYAQRLIDELDQVDYLEKIKTSQINWIGRSEGALIEFQIPNSKFQIQIFTTRPDTLFGATYLVLSPEHHLIKNYELRITNYEEVKKYQEKAKNKSDLERQENKEKTGVQLKGVMAINPATKKEIPIWVADYVLSGYGTGAIMAVPAHDDRDFAFAKKHNLKIINVVCPPFDYWKDEIYEKRHELEKWLRGRGQTPAQESEWQKKIDSGYEKYKKSLESNEIFYCYTELGKTINSDFLNGLETSKATEKMIVWLEKEKIGEKKVTYKLRDWVFSRQRYWGEPIPMVYCEHCGWAPLNDAELPLLLPEVKAYEPTDTGESPLAGIKSFVNVKCPICKAPARRETDTMPNWAGSSWYFLRYCDPHNKEMFASNFAMKYWMPVDLYNGGMEHTTLHLLYSRFWYKVLFDLGFIPSSCGHEPYKVRRSHAMILGEGGIKMSKSKGNVINPDEIVEKFGADVLRTYEMFIGPYDMDAPWSVKDVLGVKRFLDKVWTLAQAQITNYELRITNGKDAKDVQDGQDEVKTLSLPGADVADVQPYDLVLHQTIKKVSEDIDNLRFNTAVSQLMILTNELQGKVMRSLDFRSYLKLIAPFAPHLAEDLWHQLGNETSIHLETWPQYNETKLIQQNVTVAVQINGKLRGEVKVATDAEEGVVRQTATDESSVKKYLEGQKVKKVVYVKNKIINFIV